MKKPITSKTLLAAKDAGLTRDVPHANAPDNLKGVWRMRKSRLEEYLNGVNTDPEIRAFMIRESEARKKIAAAAERRVAAAERQAKETAQRIDPVVQALTALIKKGDTSLLAALWSAPRRLVLSEADWEAIEWHVTKPKSHRGRSGEHRTLLMPVLHLAYLDYLDQLDILKAQKKAALTDAERKQLAEMVALEWRDGQQVLTAEGLAEGERWVDKDGNDIPPPKKSIAKDRLVTPTSLQALAIKKKHTAYRAWLKEMGLPFPK